MQFWTEFLKSRNSSKDKKRKTEYYLDYQL